MGGWAQGLSGFGRGFMNGYNFIQQMEDRNRAQEAEKLFGQTITDVYAPRPMEGATSGAPTQAPMRMPPQIAPRVAEMQMPGQMPGAQPPGMPGAPPPSPMPPQGPAPQMGPPPGGAPPMPGAPGMQPPGPMNAPMRAPGSTAVGQSYETMPMQQSPQQLDWKTIFTSLSQRMPGADPATVGKVVDRFMPLMTAQSQMEWRELKGRIDQMREDRMGRQGDVRLEQGDRRLDQNEAKLNETRTYHTRRLAQLDRSFEASGAAKLPPDVKAQLDVYRDYYKQATTSLRTALTNQQRAQWEGTPENKAAADAEVKDAKAAEARARKVLETYTKKVLPKARLDFSAGASPSPSPGAGAAGVPKASAAPPKPGAPATPGGSQRVKTKSGAEMELGFESPEYMGTPAKATGPAARESAPANATPRTSAAPTGTQPKVYPFPQGSKETVKTMLLKGRVYKLPNGQTGKWTGTGFLPVGQ